MANYKAIPINFNLDDKEEEKIYNWIKNKRGRGGFIKDILEEKMNSENTIIPTLEPTGYITNTGDVILSDEISDDDF